MPLHLRDWHVFMWQSLKIFKVLNTLNQINFESTLNQIFLKTFSKKLEHRFLFVSTMNENATFPYKAALSEGNAKTNRMLIIKWTYHKEWSFASNLFNFRKRWSSLGGCFFPCEYPKPFHDGGSYHIETSPLICRANHWTGFYMITASVMKGLL